MSGMWWFLWAQVTLACLLAGWGRGMVLRACAKAASAEDRLAAFIGAGPYLKLTGGTVNGDLTVIGALTQSGGNITSGGTNVTGAASWINDSCYPAIGGKLGFLEALHAVAQPGQIASAPANYSQSQDQTFRVLTNDISSQLANAGIFT